MPTVTPLPSTPKSLRGRVAGVQLGVALGDDGARRQSVAAVIGASTSVTPGDAGHRGDRRQLAGLAATVTVW